MIETCLSRAPSDGYQGHTGVNHGQSNRGIEVTETPSDRAKCLVTMVGTAGIEPATLRFVRAMLARPPQVAPVLTPGATGSEMAAGCGWTVVNETGIETTGPHANATAVTGGTA